MNPPPICMFIGLASRLLGLVSDDDAHVFEERAEERAVQLRLGGDTFVSTIPMQTYI